ncbi:hypothetical protein [Sporanaerobacter acetigenes]|uniref:Uncharacterized protein n=1 Tax=Sporanaerobacter acetigenes DSM 13106 TaxID=1123281 RepID=A0A1M5U433_9FIRM|nr:hypothetical protein [Sporanaerobacter acetigenes]SHH57708.1 hypothetical protein SAMN02745180_00519 [Sporanaerobacter acetigenes DSM 13106]
MAKYLWDLNLDEIPLGWENTYQDALNQCPKGEIIEMAEMDSPDSIITNQYFYDPVGYKNTIYTIFNEYKIKAKTLFESRNKHEIKPFINELIKFDCILYGLLAEWTCNGNEFDGSSFDPNYLKNNLLDYNYYFGSYNFETDFEKQYKKYKLISL